MKSKKHLNFSSLREVLSETFCGLPEYRQTAKTDYSIHDTMMSGFACMFFQDPSLLQFQERLKEQQHQDNLPTLFGVKNIPKSSQMREVIDEVDSTQLRPVFEDYFSRLQRGKHLEQYQLFPGFYLCVLDATQYFSSPTVPCSNCLTAEHKNGDITYSHKVLQAAIMHPDMRQVIPLMPEEIRNGDGNIKQDCEINAAKRLVPKVRKDHPRFGIIFGGDGLFSHQPFISEVLAVDGHYILVAKPDDHTFMMEWIEACEPEDMGRLRITDVKGRIHIYEWVNDVPLTGAGNSIRVNFFRYQLICKDKNSQEKVTYKNNWVTDFVITESTIITLVKAGRCRWKIENECFNTLKNQGYYLEHNYGHGLKNLCFNFYLLTLLAFYFHQIFELTCRLYHACSKKFGSKRNLWENLRVSIRLIVFADWEQLLTFALVPGEHRIACQTP
mgnify:FL=1